MAVASLPSTAIRSSRDRPLWQRFLRHPLAVWGSIIVIALVFVALAGPSIAPRNPADPVPNGIDHIGVPHGLGDGFLLGADTLGRDVWTRVIYGARRTLLVAMCAAVTSTLFGTVIGLCGGYFGGRIDAWLTRLTETISSLPTILLAMTLAKVLPDELPAFLARTHVDPQLLKVLVAISFVTWTGIARAVRGQTLSLVHREFVEAARAMGCSQITIMARHLLPNVLPTVIALASLAVANNILLEAGLSYFALGVDASTPSWGGIIADGQPFLVVAPWIAVAPGVAIILAVTGFNFIGTALREVLEPKR